MTTAPDSPRDDPQHLLSISQELMGRTRQYQRATWFLLFVTSGLTFLAIPVLRFSDHTLTTCGTPNGGGHACHVYSTWGVWYWPVALIMAFLGISIFYLRRSRAQGLESRIRTFVVAGILSAIGITALGYWAVHLPVGNVVFLGLHIQPSSLELLHRIATPAGAIGISLIVLARIERNRPLFLVDLVYLIVVLAPINFGWTVSQSSNWNFLPRLVINGVLLLIAGIGFAWVQRPLRRPAR